MRICHNSQIIDWLGGIMGSQALTVELDGKCFDAMRGDNLLESLLSQGAYVRHGCRAGACGACRLYDQDNCESILSCQTSLSSGMSLTTQIPSASSVFSIVSKRTLSDAAVELTLLGPSDDSFGDRVSVSFSEDAEQGFFECMALNSAGAPLKVVLQKEAITALAWQSMLSLAEGDSLQVALSSGVRKGRLLFEMGISGEPLVVVSSSYNGVFESYWRDALTDYSVQYLGHYLLPANNEPSLGLDADAFVSFLKEALANADHGALNIIYHGQQISAQEWALSLRPLRVRTSQLHFVR
ncbi:hypothetical protein GCM10009112_00070 [Marinomonas arenicola]|uniref:2Fe-2S iron-sulfur cluster-binding protein n=1 Tax=Marinomonas TaxID=28253 RepID=UPI001404544F|nr:2Fe-2S iron-sulfur cluster binding domain-containing protein [Marinomonas sp. KMM3893]